MVPGKLPPGTRLLLDDSHPDLKPGYVEVIKEEFNDEPLYTILAHSKCDGRQMKHLCLASRLSFANKNERILYASGHGH